MPLASVGTTRTLSKRATGQRLGGQVASPPARGCRRRVRQAKPSAQVSQMRPAGIALRRLWAGRLATEMLGHGTYRIPGPLHARWKTSSRERWACDRPRGCSRSGLWGAGPSCRERRSASGSVVVVALGRIHLLGATVRHRLPGSTKQGAVAPGHKQLATTLEPHLGSVTAPSGRSFTSKRPTSDRHLNRPEGPPLTTKFPRRSCATALEGLSFQNRGHRGRRHSCC